MIRSVQGASAYLEMAKANVGQGHEWPSGVEHLPIRVAGVVGAGTMGAGIAQTLIAAGITTHLVDRDAAALNRAAQRIRKSLEGAVTRGRLTPDAAQAALDCLHLSTQIQELRTTNMVIEAVYENASLKKQVLAELDRCCAPNTWFASNTSTLDIDALGKAIERPQQFVGMHFLTPAHVVPLVEVVRGSATNAQTLANARAVAQTIGKMPIQTGNDWGFIGNRLFEAYLREVDTLLLGGLSPQRIDTALEAFGMAMGPCRTLDMAGLDISNQVIEERSKQLPGGYSETHRIVTRRLTKLGRFGVKSGRGHYLYQGNKPMPDDDLVSLCAGLRQEFGIASTADLSDDEIVERCLTPLWHESRQILQQNVAYRASDIDLVWVYGYGFPEAAGGPMFWSEKQALTDDSNR